MVAIAIATGCANLLYIEILGANYSHTRDTVHDIGYQVRSMWESTVEIKGHLLCSLNASPCLKLDLH